ncbi:DUF1772 domain-containing protein [Novosphingobium sp. MMS21-SN21R]|uniref:DUF1772 domain-containing protein n=1 Tax=Novosphingobium sp. MMS21-SN21R TaxID=2969298 RepID=UPI002884C2A6|nr:DUF1772 domain-containing protein [Novosphingobium sp. MMS21-SN21R]MDT0509970.1 DUF1772 domain-containing protein [Novosphingobium sp. MMS21-SN21R]
MAGLAALVMAAIFFGAAVYITLAEHPARLGLDDRAALAQWGPSYSRGFAMQASVAVVSGLFGIGQWWLDGNVLWLAGAAVILANWPFTMLGIMPTNRKLMAATAGPGGEVRALLVRWGRLHAVRSGLGAVATGLFFVAAA